jgi:hypothetical protein
VPGALEAMLAIGVRSRQLSVRTLFLGLLLAAADDRAAHLSRAHGALVALPRSDRLRLGVVVDWGGTEHLLTYRQVEYTFSLVVRALRKEQPDGAPSEELRSVLDALVEASVPKEVASSSTSLAVDWSDQETFARPPADAVSPGSDPEASWGHRSAGLAKEDLFFGYFLSAATMVADEGAPAVPELIRRITLSSCSLDPVVAFVPTLEVMAASGVALGDVLCDSGYAHRRAEHWALPVRRAGGRLVMDLHPHDRGSRGTFGGAICFNGNLYCPATPKGLFDLEPLARGATAEQAASHDKRSAELARYKLGPISAEDPDGYHRVMCPAAAGKVRCPRRERSMTLPFDRPHIPAPPDPAPRCCTNATLSVPAEVNAKTRQKHDYPSRSHRISYGRRTGVERSFATLKDPASTDVTRGRCRLMGLTAIALQLACAVVVRNERVLAAFAQRQRDEARRAAAGLEPRTRRRRRRTTTDLIASAR